MGRAAAIAAAAVLALGATQAPAQTVTKLDDGRHVPYYDISIPVRTAGRVRYMQAQLDPTPTCNGQPCMPSIHMPGPKMIPAFAYGWPGVYFESHISGDEVVVQLDDPTSDLDLLVDGRSVARFSKPGAAIYDVTGLGSGEHIVRLERVNEDLKTGGVFYGFFVPGYTSDHSAATPPPPPHVAGEALPLTDRDRRIEFIGDSYLSGYGTTSTKHECTPDEIHATTDTQQAWGALIAKHYDADYQINATSGIGMVRNYDGGAGPAMPELYGNDLMKVDVKAHAAETMSEMHQVEHDGVRPYGAFYYQTLPTRDWQPQVIVIALGDNDFATPVKAGEKWPDDRALRGDFIDSYLAFLKDLRARNPKALFVLMDYGEPELIPDLQAIAAIAKARGDARVLTWSAGTGFEQTGCDWHLSLNDHKRIAAGLEAFLDAQPGIWDP